MGDQRVDLSPPMVREIGEHGWLPSRDQNHWRKGGDVVGERKRGPLLEDYSPDDPQQHREQIEQRAEAVPCSPSQGLPH